MTFGQKINFIEQQYIKNPKFDDYVKLLKTIKLLRNHLAHGRLEKLVYKNYRFSDPRACLILLVDFMNAAKPKTPKNVS
ncbi:MAG: hypothetical protein UX89_C0015G0003 [Parcubacteria group bacterium GW2011_GWA2_47_16]|nr:MAG: hypothetical protein UX89_C0015G0003 [Parcubacteria group bacterium GW2011_GWA2_47_16]